MPLSINQCQNYFSAWKITKVFILETKLLSKVLNSFNRLLELSGQSSFLCCSLLYLYLSKPLNPHHLESPAANAAFQSVLCFYFSDGCRTPCATQTASQKWIEIQEHFFHLQGDETPTIRRKWLEEHKSSSKTHAAVSHGRIIFMKETIVALWT